MRYISLKETDAHMNITSKVTLIGWIGVTLIFFFLSPLFATFEPFSISSPPAPVGSGARAMGMAGAFVAVADDATAASWNPAGLIQLQTPEISGVFSWEKRSSRRYSLLDPYFENRGDSKISAINYISLLYPFSFANRNMVFSVNYQKLYDFNRNFRRVLGPGSEEEFHAKGTLYTIAPAFAIQVRKDLYFGCTINLWSDKLTGKSHWTNIYKFREFDTSTNKSYGDTLKEEYKNFRAINANIGLLYRFTPKWTLGAVFKTPFRARFDYLYNILSIPDSDAGLYYSRMTSLDFPPTYALGASYSISDAWTLSADITRTDWYKLEWRNANGRAFKLFTRFEPPTSTSCESPCIDPVYSVRFGVEYLKILENTVIPLRMGIFYDPVPSANHPHDEYGMSFGSGISLGDLIIDFAYQYRVRHDLEDNELGLPDSYNIYEDYKQNLFLFSAIYHF